MSILKKYDKSIFTYKKCLEISDRYHPSRGNYNQKRQWSINRDGCLAGVARTYFAKGEYEKASLSYLDIPKGSHIWPEILFEEAWTSFYRGNYNRSLGKLVNYKAPILNYVFNSEVEVLKALSFMELCLWDDSVNVANRFYKRYERDVLLVSKYLKRKGSLRSFYFLAKNKLKGEVYQNKLLDDLMNFIAKDPTFREIFESFKVGADELRKIKKYSNLRLRRVFLKNFKDSMVTQRDIIGFYVKKTLISNIQELQKNLTNMSYIKLESLGRSKDSLIRVTKGDNRTRGDIKNIKANEKQYFWTFNGEFWADEIGDYVFSLKSECKDKK